MIFSTPSWQRTLTAAGITVFSSFLCLSHAQAQSFSNTEAFLIAQTLGGIEREISLSEVPNPALSSATAVAGSAPTKAQVELQPDGSLVYELTGRNQQGFEFWVDVTSEGKIIEIDEQVEPSAVPEVVYRTLNRWAPNAEIVSTWRSTRLGEFVYEIVIEDVWFEISADGRRVSINPN